LDDLAVRLFHGGAPGLRQGDLIEPGHDRRSHDGCQWCAARAQLPAALDGNAEHPDRVYLTPDREYARYYASLYGRGDLYQVEPTGDLERSTEDNVETWKAPAARIIAVIDRAVTLTPSQRRRIWREWGAADRRAAAGTAGAP
jgi:hypothetical protein